VTGSPHSLPGTHCEATAQSRSRTNEGRTSHGRALACVSLFFPSPPKPPKAHSETKDKDSEALKANSTP
jgi:hypothetical protein